MNCGYDDPAGAQIGDTVFFDNNKNGVQDGGEAGQTGVTVTLKDADGNTLATDTTDAGDYGFTGLDAGTYLVSVSNGPDLADHYISTGATGTMLVVLSVNQDYQDADFGYAQNDEGLIGTSAWHDLDGDGVKDLDEPALAGIEVTLTVGSTTTTATTDAHGVYFFTDLPGDLIDLHSQLHLFHRSHGLRAYVPCCSQSSLQR